MSYQLVADGYDSPGRLRQSSLAVLPHSLPLFHPPVWAPLPKSMDCPPLWVALRLSCKSISGLFSILFSCRRLWLAYLLCTSTGPLWLLEKFVSHFPPFLLILTNTAHSRNLQAFMQRGGRDRDCKHDSQSVFRVTYFKIILSEWLGRDEGSGRQRCK